MATVFLATDLKTNRKVALKIMLPHLASNPDFVQRFLHEVRATVDLKHEHIVELFGYGQDAGRYFMACEFIDGGTVQDLLRAMGKFPLPLALELFAQLLQALAHAHAHGVIHRDLKPANMLLMRSGCLKVADFGIAKTLGAGTLTQTGMLLGTPAYMSPEQAMGQAVDARSDLYSSGVVLYEMLTGSNPRQSDNPTTSLAKVLKGELCSVYEIEPAIPSLVQEVLDGLLARDREARFDGAEAVLSRLGEELAQARRQYPALLAECLAHPAEMKQRLVGDQAMQWYRRAQDRIQAGPAAKESAALWAYHAVSLEPTNHEIQHFFGEICSTHGLQFGPSNNPKVLELEKLLEKEPETPGVLRQLAQLYRLEGNVHRAVLNLKRYLHLRPKDGYAATQLLQMTGENPLPRGVASPRTSELVAGIRTGGFRAAPPQRPTAGLGAFSPAGSLIPSTVEMGAPSSKWSQLWNGVGKRLLVVALIAAAVLFVARQVNRLIDSATRDTAQASDTLAKARDDAESGRLSEQSQRALVQSSESNAKDAARMLETARAAFNKENYAEAITGFDGLIQHHPKRAEVVTAKFLRAKALLASGQHPQAIAAFSEYLDRHAGCPEYWEALLRRGQAYHSQLEDASAVSDLDQLLQKQPTSPWAAEALVARGEIHAGRGKAADAAADFKAALARTGPSDPLNARASNDLKELGQR
jgi:serine/threonine protein kinase/outer membrane protein assembly factor BamD (BamD/ComL family)